MANLSYHAGTEGKVSKNQVKASLRHTQRLTYGAYYKHGNKDIKPSMTQYNLDYDFLGVPVEDAIEEALEMRYKAKSKNGKKKAIRKDAVVIREIIAQPSSEVFEGMTILQKQEKIADFVKDARKWIEKEFGKKNLLGASAHLDETNPHVHFMVMPLTKDGRLSQQDFFKGPGHFHLQHKDFREHMNKKGWNFDLENKYENAKGVPLMALKANGAEIQENREKLTELIREKELLVKQNKEMAVELAVKPDIQKEALDLAVQAFLENPIESGIIRAIREEAEEKARAELENAQRLADEKETLSERMISLMHESGDQIPKLPAREELKDILEFETDGRFSVYFSTKSQKNVLVDLQGEKPKTISQEVLIRKLTTVEPDGKGGSVLDIKGNAPISYVLGYYSSKQAKSAKQAHWDGLTAISREQNEMALEMAKDKTL